MPFNFCHLNLVEVKLHSSLRGKLCHSTWNGQQRRLKKGKSSFTSPSFCLMAFTSLTFRSSNVWDQSPYEIDCLEPNDAFKSRKRKTYMQYVSCLSHSYDNGLPRSPTTAPVPGLQTMPVISWPSVGRRYKFCPNIASSYTFREALRRLTWRRRGRRAATVM